jgi:hypothetical protein
MSKTKNKGVIMIKELRHTSTRCTKMIDTPTQVDTETGEIKYWFADLDRWLSNKQLDEMDINLQNWKDFVDKDTDAEILPMRGIAMAFMDGEVKAEHPELFENADMTWEEESLKYWRDKIDEGIADGSIRTNAKPMIVVQANLDAPGKE